MRTESCKKYSNTRADMLRMKQELRVEYKEAILQLRFFGLLRYDRAGMAS
ncbi:MAG: hypothetical protein H5T33_00770 [Candidatus Methanosuratus sp.]|nr:hypothetical protein [Candidatus Methanosuratincola sp.]